MKIFNIEGYWKDDKTPIQDALIAEFDSTPIGYQDDEIFYYGIAEKDLIGDHDDFIITNYKIYGETDQ